MIDSIKFLPCASPKGETDVNTVTDLGNTTPIARTDPTNAAMRCMVFCDN